MSDPPEEAKPARRNEMRAAEQARRRRRRAVKRIAVLLACLLLFPAALWAWLITPPARHHSKIRLDVPKSANIRRIGTILQDQGIIRSGLAFALYARLHRGGQVIKAGRHTVSDDMTYDQILEALAHNELRVQQGTAVTIPEGFTLAQIAARLQIKGIVTEDAFTAAARGDNPELAGGIEFALPQGTLEGYLFPDTYRFTPQTPAAEAVRAMLVNFWSRFERPYQSEIAGRGRSLHEIVTLASLIEREAKAPEDRARIAGVLENRLRRHMRLEVDATVLYALGHHKQRVFYRDLEVKSPYNTYRHRGLPPGPIANPGLDSLLAALRPERNDFLYYVARPNGKHLFSRTVAEHEAAKRQARRERKAQARDTEAPR